jgi:hypothetical protein
LKGAVAWVIGTDDSKNLRSPQIWFEKDTFLPLRMIFSVGRERRPVDLQFENYKVTREIPYPRMIQLIGSKNEIVYSSQLIDFTVSPESVGSHSGHTGFTEAGKSASSELGDLIRTYYGSIR